MSLLTIHSALLLFNEYNIVIDTYISKYILYMDDNSLEGFWKWITKFAGAEDNNLAGNRRSTWSGTLLRPSRKFLIAASYHIKYRDSLSTRVSSNARENDAALRNSWSAGRAACYSERSSCSIIFTGETVRERNFAPCWMNRPGKKPVQINGEW